MSSGEREARKTAVRTPAECEVVLGRVFDAPRERVFEACSDPALIPRWWGESATVETMDARPGGEWRYLTVGSDGRETAFRGSHR
jgi:uncharacterized protein YndB with AHSA1/START domain